MQLDSFKSNSSIPWWIVDHKNGGFIDKNNAVRKEKLIDVIPCGVLESRLAWSDGNPDGKVRPLCKSPDGITGYLTDFGMDADIRDTIKQECSECPLHAWVNNKQACQKKLYMPLITDDELLKKNTIPQWEMLEISRSGASVVKKFMGNLSIKKNDLSNMILMSISTKDIIKNDNQYSVVQFDNITELYMRNFELESRFHSVFNEAKLMIEAAGLPRQRPASSIKGMSMG